VSTVTEPGLNGSAPFVSIQCVDIADQVEGHLAWGALINSDVVMVDFAAFPLEGRLEVLIASEGSAGSPLVERIELAKVEIVGVEGWPRSSVAAVKLAHSSLQTPTSADFDLKAVRREIAEDHDLWRGLERLGYVPEGIRDIDTATVLAQVTKWEDELRSQLIRDTRPLPGDAVALRMCCFWRCKSCRDEF
jgi:hypothetical protein